MAASFVDDDGFGEAVLGAHAVLAPEELEKAETSFENGGSITEGALDGLPEPQAGTGERDGARAGYEFTRRAAVAKVIEEAEVEKHEEQIAGLVEIPDQADVLLVEDFEAPENFDGRPEEDGKDQVDEIAQEALGEGGEGETVESAQAGTFMSMKAARTGMDGWFGRRSGHGWR